MKTKLLILLAVLLIVGKLQSQEKFLVSIENHYWNDINSKEFINLQINIKVKNVGNVAGVCNDLYGIFLYSSSDIYNYMIEGVDASSLLLNKINPGDAILGFLTFKVPKDADDLELKFSEENGGARKYITKSYNKSAKEELEAKIEKENKAGDEYYFKNQYDEAIKKYTLCATYDPTRKEEFHKKIGNCYSKIADEQFAIYSLNKSETAYDNYVKYIHLIAEYDKNNLDNNRKLLQIYEKLGDEKFSQGKYDDAIREYNKGLKYFMSSEVQAKLIKAEEILFKSKTQKQETTTSLERYNYLIQPKTGIIFKAGAGVNMNSRTAYSSYFWNIQLDVPIKLGTVRPPSPAFAFYLNIDAGYQGLIGSTGEVERYYGILGVQSKGAGPLVGEFNLNAGAGLALLGRFITPMLTAYYGFYGQYQGFSLPNNYYGTQMSSIAPGSGFKIDFSLMISKNPGFVIGYNYRNYNLYSSLYFLDNGYSGHQINLGIINF